jgi:transcriptional regulator with XRE-family HTH domain
MSVTGAQVRMARAALGWTVRDLAEAAGLHRNTITNIEIGRFAGDPGSIATIERVLRAAGIEFLDENGGGAGVRFRKPRHARLKGSEREPLRPSLRVGSKGSGRTVSSGIRETMPPILPPGPSLSIPKELKDIYSIHKDDATLSSELLRAARALLRWAQRDLCAASLVSLPTIKRLEAKQGVLAANATTVAALRHALESAGIEFTGGASPGVKLKRAPVPTASDQRRRGRKKEPQR